MADKWYSRQSNNLDLNSPICAFGDGGYFFLLLPHLGEQRYEVIGYDWFNVNDGCWNSCTHYPTVGDAVMAYKQTGYDVANVTLTIAKAKGEPTT